MKLILVAMLILSIQTSSFDKIFGNEIVAVDDNQDGRYEKCFILLAKIAAESAEIAALIASKQYQRIPPLAIKLMKDVQDDIKCFQEGVNANTFLSLLSKATNADDCYMTHMRNAAMAIREAVQDLSLKLYKEAAEQILIALKELALAQACPKN